MLLPVDSLWLQLLLLLPTYSTILGLSSSYEERGFNFFLKKEECGMAWL
jgi:hypothetical protein